jgi:DNA-binding NtrC family response regulator
VTHESHPALPAVLIVDDDPSIVRGFSRFLTAAGYSVSETSTLGEAREQMEERRFDAVILDLYLPDGRGIDWISELRAGYPSLAIILVTGEGDIPTAVEALRLGGDNFLTKPVNMSELDVFLRKCLEVGALRQRDYVRRRLKSEGDRFWGVGAAMTEVMKLAAVAAKSGSPLLIEGETGTGKGVLSRWIHDRSCHRESEMVEVNCSSLKGELLVSELFGHVRGAFTSAVQDRVGLIEVADGGTLFLDEIGDMDGTVQAQFLKVIEEKRFRPLGSAKVRRSDFRLICATHRDLGEKVKDGSFREDLFFRINVFPIRIPPLRDRMEDLPGLIGSLLGDLGAPDAEVLPGARKLMEEYSWPGNVRELRNVLERALMLSPGKQLGPSHLPSLRHGGGSRRGAHSPMRGLERVYRDHILEIMESTGGDTKEAAAILGISRSNLYRKLKKIRRAE